MGLNKAALTAFIDGEAMDGLHDGAVKPAVAAYRTNVGKQTYDLVRSIHSYRVGRGYRIVSSLELEYGDYHEYGTSRTRANPAFRAALNGVKL